MNYTLRQLQIFLTVSQAGSITRAAEVLHLTQPAVSIQLRNLSDQFEEPIFEVVGKKVYITDFGQVIVQAAERILDEAYAISAQMHQYKGELTGRLKISVVSTGKYVMPYFLTGFLQAHPNVELQMDVTNKTAVVKSLEKNEVDFALVSLLPDGLRTQGIRLMKNKLCLVASGAMQFEDKVHDKKILEQLRLIYREPGSATRFAMERFLSQRQLRISRKLELTSNEAVKQAVIAGLGCSIMPLIGIHNELESGQLQIVPVRGLPIHSQWQLIWLHGKKFSPVASYYHDYLQREKQAIIDDKFSWYQEL